MALVEGALGALCNIAKGIAAVFQVQEDHGTRVGGRRQWDLHVGQHWAGVIVYRRWRVEAVVYVDNAVGLVDEDRVSDVKSGVVGGSLGIVVYLVNALGGDPGRGRGQE